MDQPADNPWIRALVHAKNINVHIVHSLLAAKIASLTYKVEHEGNIKSQKLDYYNQA
jgi:hypothetical protein